MWYVTDTRKSHEMLSFEFEEVHKVAIKNYGIYQ